MTDLTQAEKIYEAIIQREQERQGPLAFIMHNHVPEKSALLQRLRSGQRPLILPPPCAHSYPWYGAIEDSGPHTVMVEDLDGPGVSENTIWVQREPWTIKERLTESEYLVSHRSWEHQGFLWKLSKLRVSAEEASHSIYPHHDPSLGRAKTLEDLIAISDYLANQQRQDILEAINRESSGVPVELPPPNGLRSLSIDFKVRAQDEMLRRRRNEGLPDEPTEQEVNTHAARILETLKADIEIDETGHIHFEEWRLERTYPETLSDTIYLAVNPFDEGTRPHLDS